MHSMQQLYQACANRNHSNNTHQYPIIIIHTINTKSTLLPLSIHPSTHIPKCPTSTSTHSHSPSPSAKQPKTTQQQPPKQPKHKQSPPAETPSAASSSPISRTFVPFPFLLHLHHHHHLLLPHHDHDHHPPAPSTPLHPQANHPESDTRPATA
ncbi:hypothetical protein EJ05DRAFT_479678 [Pseudovirgaria hyperparasitica]|uniref:Uncharacterized protein n=1 Tax=Pseudovirgaria hyperparasitica TaxID=470096 RepID=A0A6A6VWV9_9PEZI|nr:uncharacterized protein EJ05DRAFT_479678 [Pseudovirgaria hyperparasitica]KAF2754130.1 hypothetical protein EJ05DRAFT_479678 [Pseudovirgaria hyperparasitica]